jgi:hypothetical protein
MSNADSGRSRELDEVRRMLFPALSPEEGWARIDRAIQDADDDDRWAAIEETARHEHLSIDLLRRLRSLREKDREHTPPPDLHNAKLDAYLVGYRAATEAPWWDSVDAAFRSSSIRSELHASFVRGWENGKAAVTPPDDPAA